MEVLDETGLALADALLHLGAKVADETLNGPGGGVSEGADGVSFDLACDLLEHVDLLELCVADNHAIHDGREPRTSLATGSALAAALVLVKLAQSRDCCDDIGALVHHDHGSGSESRFDVSQSIKVHPFVFLHVRQTQSSRSSL